LIAQRWGLDREQQDRYASESHRRAHQAATSGGFDREIVPIRVRASADDEERLISADETIRPNTDPNRTPTPAVPDAKRALLALAARSHGIGTVADLADYYRVSIRSARIALAELVEEGEVSQVRVRGWKEPAFLHKDARIPRRVNGSALLCPFDPLIWARERTERLFGARYRIEIYTPAAQRQYGYYVLPLLVGEQIVGRFDLKADRATGRLLVQASWSEPDTDAAAAADAAAVELVRMAGWLGLGETVVLPRGDLWHTLVARPGMRPGSA